MSRWRHEGGFCGQVICCFFMWMYITQILYILKQRNFQFSSVQSLSRVRISATPWTAVLQASLSITNSRSSFRLTSIEYVVPSSHLILCRSLFLLPPIPPSIRVFSNESTLHMRWPKYFQLQHLSFQRTPRTDHLKTRRTLKVVKAKLPFNV